MFNIGVTEILLILGVALLVLGPNKLPEVARMVGRGLREFRRTARELEEELDPIRETLQPEYYGDLNLDEQDLADAERHERELDGQSNTGKPAEEGEEDGEPGEGDEEQDDSANETVSIRPPDGERQPFRDPADDPDFDPIAYWDVREDWDEPAENLAETGDVSDKPKDPGGDDEGPKTSPAPAPVETVAAPAPAPAPVETVAAPAPKKNVANVGDRKKPADDSSEERDPASKTT